MNSQHRFFRQSVATTVLVATLLFLFRSYFLVASAYSGCGGDLISPTNAGHEARIIELVNEQRAAQGLPPMKFSAPLTDAARYHAADMRQDDYFNHQTHDRSAGALVKVCNWSDRLKVYYTIFSGLGENIAFGYSSPESVMEGWMNSSGHRSNILGNYREIGVGYYENYWVQDFGDRNDSFPVIINREAQQTDSPQVTLYIYGAWQEMRLRNDDNSWSGWQTFQQESTWTLQNATGERRVEVELKNSATTVVTSDTILLTATTAPEATPTATPTATPAPTPTPIPVPTFETKASIYLPTIQR